MAGSGEHESAAGADGAGRDEAAQPPPRPQAGRGHEHGRGGGHPNERFAGPLGLMIGLTMLVRRGRSSRLIADRAGVRAGDRVVDIGCGPGSAAREAARRGAAVTGVDPAPVMLRLARLLSGGAVTYLEGAAEALPLADGSATAAWAISSAHHWSDLAAGLREIHRVLAPGGRLVVAERLTRPGAGGLRSHGFTDAKAVEFAEQARAAGFADVSRDAVRMGRRTIGLIHAVRPA